MTAGADRPVPDEPPNGLRWVKPPQQARSQKTLARLLDAAEELILERGVTALTVSEVARRGGSSVGAFYARFPDKDALLATLHERSCEEALATTEAALDPGRWTGQPLDVVVGEVIRFTAGLCEQRLGLLLAFISAAATDTSYADRRARLEVQMADRLEAFLLTRKDEIAHDDLRVAARLCMGMILSTLEYGALVHRSAPVDPSRAVIAAELSRAVLGYLGVPVSSGRRRS